MTAEKLEDPWTAGQCKFKTRSALLASRHQAKEPEDYAGGAPIKEPSSFKVDRSTKEYAPLSPSVVRKGSRKHLLQSRSDKLARDEQSAYDKWEATTCIWEVPSFGLAADHVANPKHATRSQILAENRREKRMAADMAPENSDPKFDPPRPQQMTVGFVENPKAATRKQMFAQRKTGNLNDMAATLKASRGHLGPKERLTKREDQWTLARLSQKAGRSRRQMFEDRKMERMNYEEECHEANKAKHNKESRKWSDRPADAWWAHRPGHVAQPREQSAARLFTTQREYLKPERYNVYSDAEPDPFKAEHHAKKERDDDETPTNVAKINQYPREEFVANLKNMRGKETNFTDYQLYFRDGIRDQVAGVESALEDEPLYSSFTANNQFDPNLWLPPHMQKYGRGGGGKDDDLASEISSTELASLQSGASSIAGSLDGGKPRARPDSAKPELNDRTVVATPAVSKGYKQRPATSVPNKRGGVAPLKQGGKQARPWTSGGSRDIQRGAKPNSLVQTLSLPSGGRIRPQSGVRTGGWQLLDTTIPISAPSITPNI